ncbi:MAG TPA: DUF3516 domain-containing protein, partial [Myxococcota bacterium]|nr:DUF3516 domain-containing protein [Myxococcota bacterium]
WVRSSERPVPLDYTYAETPIHETLADLIRSRKAPIYVVNFTQRECVEQAQNVLSTDFCSKEEKAAISAALAGFRFDSPFGKEMRRFVSHGVGLHHAGLLPKYRLLVEKLAQEGLLKIIMGTDTLGVGVNVPIRAVLFTKLCKFDGEKTALLSVRDFKQIAGRAGRKGFDEQGSVICQAPEHVIENKRMENKAEGNPAKMRKLVKKKPPTKNYVPWDAKTFEKLIHDHPEPLQSRFSVSFSLVLTLLQSAPDGYRRLVRLIEACHDSAVLKGRHRRQARVVFKSLRAAKVIGIVKNRLKGNRVVVNENLQNDFSLNQSLSLYLLDTLARLDRDSTTYGLDVLTLVESICENPMVILNKQVDKLKDARMAEMKAEGLEYEQRIEELDKIEYPKPNRDFIYDTFNAYADAHPWVGSENIHPKSVAREMIELCASFPEYIKEYGLQRSEGVLLRYLSQVYKALVQTVPESYRDASVEEVIIFLRTLLGRVDSSLVEEWEDLLSPAAPEADVKPTTKPRAAFDPAVNPRAFAARVRTELHRLVKALAQKDYEEALACLAPVTEAGGGDPWTPERLAAAMAPYYEAHRRVVFDPSARLPQYTHLKQLGPRTWQAQQTLCDPEGENFWMCDALIDLEGNLDANAPLLQLQRIGT